MTQKELFDQVSVRGSKLMTRSYSTSFSLGILFLDSSLRDDIYSIYGFVRVADEIVDTFHDFNKKELLTEFWGDTYLALDRGISLNPVLNAFQSTVNQYAIDRELIDTFLKSMEMDLAENKYDQEGYEQYILGSAEVVGLMCLKVFVKGDEQMYEDLKPYAMKLGAAFQKINFLRDLQADFGQLGRVYFPGVSMDQFDALTKQEIEADIAKDFEIGLEGIKMLPKTSRFGVYVAYVYYTSLFKKIQNTPVQDILTRRIRIPNNQKLALLGKSYVKHSVGLM